MATDSFTYSNGALATVSSGVWANVSGGGAVQVTSNTARLPAASFTAAIYNTATATQTQVSEVVITELATSSYSEMGVITRATGAGAQTFYYAYYNTVGLGELHRVSAGSFNLLDDVSVSHSGAHELRLESTGSTHNVYLDDSLIMTGTDANLTGTYVGIAGFADAINMQQWDDWRGETISGAVAGRVRPRRLPQLTYRGNR